MKKLGEPENLAALVGASAIILTVILVVWGPWVPAVAESEAWLYEALIEGLALP